MNSRRDVLRHGAGLTGIGLATTLAGCSSVPVVGSFFGDEPVYPEWVYDPETVDGESIRLKRTDVSRMLDLEAVPDEDAREGFADEFGGADIDDVDYVLEFDRNEIMSVSFDGTEVADELDAESEGSYGSFDLYSDGRSVTAVSEEYILESSERYDSDRTARDRTELLIDTYEGEADRFVDENEHFERAVDALETGVVVEANAGSSSRIEEANDDDVVAEGMVAEADDESTLLRVVEVYKSEDGYDESEIESQFEGYAESESDVELADLSADGPTVVGEFEMPTEMFVEDW